MDSKPPMAAPRWGTAHRDRKAEAIWTTLVRCGVAKFGHGQWLDVGCGSGGIAACLAHRTEQFIGVDPEPWPDWPSKASAVDNLSFLVASFDAAAPPVGDATMDVVVCNQVYEHVRDPARLIANIARVMKPDGACYFAGPNLVWPIEPHVFWPFVHWLPRARAQAVMTSLGSRKAAELDAFSATSWQLKRWFANAGLSAAPLFVSRLAGELEAREWRGAARFVRLLPEGPLGVFAPIAPGFAFLLRKSPNRAAP